MRPGAPPPKKSSPPAPTSGAEAHQQLAHVDPPSVVLTTSDRQFEEKELAGRAGEGPGDSACWEQGPAGSGSPGSTAAEKSSPAPLFGAPRRLLTRSSARSPNLCVTSFGPCVSGRGSACEEQHF